jgi:hypothetical protein
MIIIINMSSDVHVRMLTLLILNLIYALPSIGQIISFQESIPVRASLYGRKAIQNDTRLHQVKRWQKDTSDCSLFAKRYLFEKWIQSNRHYELDKGSLELSQTSAGFYHLKFTAAVSMAYFWDVNLASKISVVCKISSNEKLALKQVTNWLPRFLPVTVLDSP